MSATEPGRQTARFPLFDGLRALAALAIVVYHIGPFTAAGSVEGALAPYFARLNVGVAVFFAISGFLLYRPMLAARARDQHFSLPTYARCRFLRIVPGYWVALTVLMIFPGLPDMPSARNWVYYFFAQGYDSHTVHSGIGPAWSLGCEVIYYAVLPLLTMAFTSVARRAGKRICWRFELLAIGMMVAGSVVYRITMVPDPASGPPATFQSNFGWFALGMVLAMASVASEDQPTRWLGRVKRHAWTGWPVAAIAYLALCRCAGTIPSLAVTSDQNTAQQLLIYALSGAVAVGLTLPAACQTTPRGVIGHLLGSPVLTRAGIISYGLYLYHVPIMIKLNAVMMTSSHTTFRLVLLTTATLALATVAATLSYCLIERPALGLARRITARTRTGMTAALGDASA